MRAAFTFFEEHPDFVRLVRREALEGGPILARRAHRVCCSRCSTAAPSSSNARWTPAGSAATTPRQLLLTGYGAVLSYLSDAPLMTGLLDVDPLSPEALADRREHVIDVLRSAPRSSSL